MRTPHLEFDTELLLYMLFFYPKELKNNKNPSPLVFAPPEVSVVVVIRHHDRHSVAIGMLARCRSPSRRPPRMQLRLLYTQQHQRVRTVFGQGQGCIRAVLAAHGIRWHFNSTSWPMSTKHAPYLFLNGGSQNTTSPGSRKMFEGGKHVLRCQEAKSFDLISF